jgi:hypothetical protein
VARSPSSSSRLRGAADEHEAATAQMSTAASPQRAPGRDIRRLSGTELAGAVTRDTSRVPFNG